MSTSEEAVVRRFARAAEPLHSCSYYAEEITQFTELGYKGWWHAYFAYRSSPLGRASSAEVTDVFYNFAPRLVERAVPSCWEILDPQQTRTKQLELLYGTYVAVWNALHAGLKHHQQLNEAIIGINFQNVVIQTGKARELNPVDAR